MMMTARARVMRVTPPMKAPAPMSAKAPGSIHAQGLGGRKTPGGALRRDGRGGREEAGREEAGQRCMPGPARRFLPFPASCPASTERKVAARRGQLIQVQVQASLLLSPLGPRAVRRRDVHPHQPHQPPDAGADEQHGHKHAGGDGGAGCTWGSSMDGRG
jgi:hypothetical protein